MDHNELASMALLAIVLAGAVSLRGRIGAGGGHAGSWWIGAVHGLLAVLTLSAATFAHDFAFRCAMITFTAYAVGMAASETMFLLKAKQSA
jgi:hypothetical protein